LKRTATMTTSGNASIVNRICAVFVRSLAVNVDTQNLPVVQDLSSVTGLDSLAMLRFVAGLEEEFGVEIEPERLNIQFLSNLQALTEYFAQRLPAAPEEGKRIP